jgi:hypothetical protein
LAGTTEIDRSWAVMGTIIEDSRSRRTGAHEPVRFVCKARAARD